MEFFEAVSRVKDWGYDGFRFWRNITWLDEEFIHFNDDVQAEEIVNHKFGSNVDGHIWVEHGVKDMLSKVSKRGVDQFSEEEISCQSSWQEETSCQNSWQEETSCQGGW